MNNILNPESYVFSGFFIVKRIRKQKSQAENLEFDDNLINFVPYFNKKLNERFIR